MLCKYPLYRIPATARILLPPDLIRKLPREKNGAFFLNQQKAQPFLRPDLRGIVQEIGCGRCVVCRINRARQWAVRCMMEAETSPCCYFVTLTYDDDHLPVETCLVDWRSGAAADLPVLRKKDLQDFMKRLRSKLHYAGYKNDVRFFACGEYGSVWKTWRPHYHILLYGMPDLLSTGDLIPSDVQTAPDARHYFSGLISECWKFGRHDVGEVTWESSSYVARYCLKKAGSVLGADLPSPEKDPAIRIAKEHPGDDTARRHAERVYKTFEAAKPFFRPPEFVLMSRRPGIGAYYFDRHREQFDVLDGFVAKLGSKVQTVRSIAYFDRLFDLPNRAPTAERTKYSAVLRRRKARRSMIAQSQAELIYRSAKDHAPRDEQAAADERRALSYLKNKVQYLDQN